MGVWFEDGAFRGGYVADGLSALAALIILPAILAVLPDGNLSPAVVADDAESAIELPAVRAVEAEDPAAAKLRRRQAPVDEGEDDYPQYSAAAQKLRRMADEADAALAEAPYSQVDDEWL